MCACLSLLQLGGTDRCQLFCLFFSSRLGGCKHQRGTFFCSFNSMGASIPRCSTHPSIHLKCFKRWQNTPFSYPITSSRFLHGEHAGSPKVLRSTTTSRVGWAELSLTKRGVHEEIGPSWLPLQHNMLHTRIIHSVLDVLVPTCRLCWGGGGDYLKYLAASSHS